MSAERWREKQPINAVVVYCVISLCHCTKLGFTMNLKTGRRRETLPEAQWSAVQAEQRQSPASLEWGSQPWDSAGPTASGKSPAWCSTLLGGAPCRQKNRHKHSLLDIDNTCKVKIQSVPVLTRCLALHACEAGGCQKLSWSPQDVLGSFLLGC